MAVLAKHLKNIDQVYEILLTAKNGWLPNLTIVG